MDIRKLQRAIVDGLEDVKGHDIKVFNTEHLSPLFERVIIASGTSNRQTKALAASVRDAVKSRGMQVLRTEGQDNGEWIIVDCGAAVAHIMQPAIRDYYHLEEIWGDKPVRMKIDGEAKALPKASAPTAPGRTRPAADGSRGEAHAVALARPAPAAGRPSAQRPASAAKRAKAAPASPPRSRGAKGAVTSITGTARGGSTPPRKSAAAAPRKSAAAAPRKSASALPRKPTRKPGPKR